MSTLQQWTPKTLGELLIFTGGSQPPLSVFSKTEHEGYIRLIQIRDYKTDKYTTYIPKDLARRFCDADDIMIGRYGPPIFQILRGLEGAYNVALIKVTPKENIFKDFAWHYLRNDRLFKHIDKLSRRTSGQTGVDLNELENYPIQLPPLAEQQKIAQALTDADNYISVLEKLIEKKIDLKLGIMQKLLSSKVDWTSQRLGDISESYSGGTPNTGNYSYYQGDINFITSGDLNKPIINNVSNKISKLGLENSSACMVPKGTLLIAMYGATAGICAITNISGAINQAILAILPHKAYSNLFLFYTLTYRKKEIIREFTQGGQPNLSAKTLQDLSINFPPLHVQEYIANTLNDFDNELNNLKSKLKKVKLLKIGMMQKLLTGEIRLA